METITNQNHLYIMFKKIPLSHALLLAVMLLPAIISAQYFGKNKARYEVFDFKVVESPHFHFYHYLNNPQRLDELINTAEQWYTIHQEVLKDTIAFKNPFILYANHPDFQQTSSIQGAVGIGTGGVTEALKNRVVLPIAMTNRQTHHVIGHELVHAFQYNMILHSGDSTSLRDLANIPLWMVEGLAEYLSIGRHDAHTAMWMRDALLHDDIPDLKDLDNYYKYFPYRWGQVFWSVVTSIYGDGIIKPLFVATAKNGLELACEMVLGVKVDKLSEIWKEQLQKHFAPFVFQKEENKIGKRILSDKNAGDINLAPILSPDGKYVVFLSEKDVFGIDMFLAEARSGKIIRKLSSTTRASHFDDYNYIESAGTWSPDSKHFAFAAVRKGQNVLVIKNISNGKTKEYFEIKGVPAFANPIWSPDGKHIVVTGLVEGQIDLYEVNVNTKKVRPLTDDIYSELLPNWSVDGSRIVFSTDELSMKAGSIHGKWKHNIATLEVATGSKTHIPVFSGADNLNPVFNHKDDIYFVSDRDGYRNLYKLDMATQSLYQLTNFVVGISGITAFAPCISVSKYEKRDRLLFTQFLDGKYSIYGNREDNFDLVPVNPDDVHMEAATLPLPLGGVQSKVETSLDNMETYSLYASSLVRKEIPYKSRFTLDYI
ncbi:MAG TPA: hypothetical protein ENJ45_02065, partial [Phaeodactylibacter sp.]|nr:hypothetical protein [Phaeodactylibacter sp.]